MKQVAELWVRSVMNLIPLGGCMGDAGDAVARGTRWEDLTCFGKRYWWGIRGDCWCERPFRGLAIRQHHRISRNSAGKDWALKRDSNHCCCGYISSQMCLNKLPFWIILDFQKCEDSTENSHMSFPRSPLILTSYITMVHLSTLNYRLYFNFDQGFPLMSFFCSQDSFRDTTLHLAAIYFYVHICWKANAFTVVKVWSSPEFFWADPDEVRPLCFGNISCGLYPEFSVATILAGNQLCNWHFIL